VLERHGITQSMSRRGNCLDNAPMVRAAERKSLRERLGNLAAAA
jgi:transposase InsO family protein